MPSYLCAPELLRVCSFHAYLAAGVLLFLSLVACAPTRRGASKLVSRHMNRIARYKVMEGLPPVVDVAAAFGVAAIWTLPSCVRRHVIPINLTVKYKSWSALQKVKSIREIARRGAVIVLPGMVASPNIALRIRCDDTMADVNPEVLLILTLPNHPVVSLVFRVAEDYALTTIFPRD